MTTRTLALIAALLFSSMLSAAEPATQLEWSLDTALSHTDNATLVNTDEISDTIGSVGGAINLTREGSRLNATLRGAGIYRDYFDNTYNGNFEGSAATALEFAIIGDTLSWSLDDSFGQTTTNENEPSTPDNRGNVNVFSTGPDVRLRLGGPNELVIAGRYENSSYQDSSSTNSHEWSGDAAVVHRVSSAVAWSLHGSVSRVDYDEAGVTGYDQQEVFVRLESGRVGQTLTADLGVAFVDGSDGTDQKPLVRINWLRRVSPSWNVQMNAGAGFENAGQQFDAGVADGPELGGTQDIILTNEVHRYDTADLTLNFERPRTTFSLSGGVDRERYPDSSDLDRDIWSVSARASRQITERIQATVNADHENRDFSGQTEDDHTTAFTLGINWHVGKTIFLGLQGGHEKRSGSTTFTYDETVYQASLSYRPSGR